MAAVVARGIGREVKLEVEEEGEKKVDSDGGGGG